MDCIQKRSDWCRYETGRHLWLVLEYCVGGDLKSLLEKDRQLPEDSIHDFAAGLVSSLQYCHSQVAPPCQPRPHIQTSSPHCTVQYGVRFMFRAQQPAPGQPLVSAFSTLS